MTDETPEGTDLPSDREVLTWELLGEATRHLAQAVVDSGFAVDVVVAVARGGLPAGGAMAYALGTKAVGTLNVEFYTGVDQRLAAPAVLPPLLDTDALTGLHALVVDDVADTGETLALVRDLMAQHCAQVRTAVLYAKSRSVIEPDYVWRRTDRWITFPWSALPVVSGDTPVARAVEADTVALAAEPGADTGEQPEA
ncbi:phosphoribosyltransferase family protein [Isoptericola sp. b441]|uniref:Phosphoribosyltransferase family protein n=1 Tax=Actinotalea lenta TaxID=3064654 RepID=A0ABT9DD73_9CELL|nr:MULTISPECIES: phosphoribosyltransferase family protein [unclassified Isoptericola]MDO8107306.1 phosphoribosyltransferase family protein [Isoptericola sp. b441]MDO8121032.1 phosphoribosyltransferase family protein [Isoptericola sp. b490]